MDDQPNTEPKADQAEGANFFDKLVGEDKKYSNPEKLAKAYSNASDYIEHLQRETNEMREELHNRMSLEDFLNSKNKETETETTDETVTKTTEVITPPEAEGTEEEVKEEVDLANQVRQILQEESTKAVQERNQERVVEKLVETYGDAEKAGLEVEQTSKRLGFSRADLLSIASRSPEAFFELMGLRQKGGATTTGGTKSTLNTEAVATARKTESSAKENTYAYFQEMRRENPSLYYSASTQNRMFKLAQEAAAKGEDFYTRN